MLHLMVTSMKGIAMGVHFQRSLISKGFWLCWPFWLISGSHLLLTTPQFCFEFCEQHSLGRPNEVTMQGLCISFLAVSFALGKRRESLGPLLGRSRCRSWCLLLLWAPVGRALDWTQEEGEDRAGEGGGSYVDVYIVDRLVTNLWLLSVWGLQGHKMPCQHLFFCFIFNSISLRKNNL